MRKTVKVFLPILLALLMLLSGCVMAEPSSDTGYTKPDNTDFGADSSKPDDSGLVLIEGEDESRDDQSADVTDEGSDAPSVTETAPAVTDTADEDGNDVEDEKENNDISEGSEPDDGQDAVVSDEPDEESYVSEDGEYSSKEEVAEYLWLYGHLPSNYITKSEAQDLGWDSSKGNLWKVAPGMSIGGDRFGNYEGLLPSKKGRKYSECDIDFDGGYRNAKRIIFSNDGLIYYTDDHYEHFELLYGEE